MTPKSNDTPGTIEHFQATASEYVLDTDEEWQIEGWELEIIGEILRGVPVTWALVPEGNGKTTAMAGLCVYLLDTEGAELFEPRVVVAAATAKQATWLYDQAEGIIRRTPGMAKRFRCLRGFKEIRRTGKEVGNLQVFAGGDKEADGAIFTHAFVDELHNHVNLRLYRIWRGKLTKRGGQLAVISTAGAPESEFEEARSAILRTAKKVTRKGKFDQHIRAEGADIVLHDWAVRDRVQATDFKVVSLANPRKSITAAVLKAKKEAPDSTDEHFLRYSCNIATRESGLAITPEVWDALREEGLEADAGVPKYGFLDLGWEIDTTAMGVLAWEDEFRRLIVGVKILEPPVDEADVVAGLVYLQREFGPKVWVVDPNASGKQMVKQLEKGTHPDQNGVRFDFAFHTQDHVPMCLAAIRFDEAIRNGWIRHDGHAGLRKHVLSAVKLAVGQEKWRYARPPEAKGEARGRYPTDALIGAVMAHSVAVEAQEQGSRTVVVY